MGADLYIEKITNETTKRWRKELDKAKPGRRKWEYYWSKMYPATGYFRDSYNDGNLLWKFGLSYWNDFPKLMRRGSQLMSPAKVKILLKMLKEREESFQIGIAMNCSDEERRYYLKKYKRLKRFLNNAIKLNTFIRCSI
ncbi:hypothetical protein A2Z67_04960 [Candidatus Woesebacteria bacterium RBG_13_36_22]|uniref:Uncharacterized protein n=1 Tax=Candidatus Woesebacteria bacterium RBG_13_36_22 TaxID=1802478 RepID=A0A1F7X2R3_9BACT|nr:MAG: hypothetical protein A2Z67_04960 [Candidatus Woesebacteria bacterium RBG_13_36_22]